MSSYIVIIDDMRSTITVDDELFEKAAEIVGDDNVSTVVRTALEKMVSTEARLRLMRLAGSAPDFTVASRARSGAMLAAESKSKGYGKGGGKSGKSKK